MQEESKKSSVLTVEEGKKFTLTEVSSVNAFSETHVTLTVNGKKVRFTGTDFKVLSFSKSTGVFTASGSVGEVRLEGRKISLLK